MGARYYTRRELMMDAAVIKPPQGYVWVEYITNPSTAYINTGIQEKDISQIEGDVRLNINNNATNMFMGATDTGLYLSPTAGFFSWNGDITINTGGSYMRFDFILRNGYVRLGTTTRTFTTKTLTSSSTIYIFARNTSTGSAEKRRARASCWGFKIYGLNGHLLRNYRPIKRLSDNKYGLWDEVNKTFNTSVTSINFTGGSIIS